MILDRKGGVFTRVLDWYIARKVAGAFRGVWVRGALPSSEGGLLVYANHSSWWDGFLVHQLGRAAGWNAYAMMREDTLARYPFHTRIGAFSVSAHPSAALSSVRYAKQVLARPGAAVFIFPEGELSAGQGPLRPLMGGVALLARAAKVRCLPVGIRYAFLEAEHPDVLLEVGVPHAPAELPVFTAQLEQVYGRVLEARSTDGFQPLLAGRRGVQQRWDGLRRRLAAGPAPASAPDGLAPQPRGRP